jgi:hypothetical protein
LEKGLIIGKCNGSQMGTLVERTTLGMAVVKLKISKADLAFTKIFNRFDSQMRRAMTNDQGSEMRHHIRLTQYTGVDGTSPTRELPGSAASTKTPTGCSASTCRRERICRSSPDGLKMIVQDF